MVSNNTKGKTTVSPPVMSSPNIRFMITHTCGFPCMGNFSLTELEKFRNPTNSKRRNQSVKTKTKKGKMFMLVGLMKPTPGIEDRRQGKLH